MNPQEDPRLERQIDRLLRDLPELEAPDGLTERTMATIEREAARARAFRPWTSWPLAVRAASLAVMLLAFGGLCVAHWALWQTPVAASLTQHWGNDFSALGATVGAAGALVHVGVLAVESLSWWVIALFLVASASAYLACVGLGVAAAKLTVARR